MYCSSCGAEAASNLNYCSRCGTDLTLHADSTPIRTCNDSTGYLAIALGFTTLGGIIALISGVIKLAEMGVEAPLVAMFGVTCALLIFGIAFLIVRLMMKLNGITGDKTEVRTNRQQKNFSNPTTLRSLDEHREGVPLPFTSVTDHTTRFLEEVPEKSKL